MLGHKPMESLGGDIEENTGVISGHRKSKLKSLKTHLFGTSNKEGGKAKLSQSESDIMAGQGFEGSEKDLVCSQGMMGSRALSHDSIFLADLALTEAEPARVLSQENVPSKIKALQMKLQLQKMHLGPPPLVLPIRRPEDQESRCKDNSLPCSPTEISRVDVGTQGTLTKTISQPFAYPLLPPLKPAPIRPVTQTPSHPLSPSFHSNSSVGAKLDFSSPAQFTPCLDTSAARHRMSVKPRNQRASSKRRLPATECDIHSQNNIDHPQMVLEEELSTQKIETLETEHHQAVKPVMSPHLPLKFQDVAQVTPEVASSLPSFSQQDQTLPARPSSVTPPVLRVKPQTPADVPRLERPHSSLIPSELQNKREDGFEFPVMPNDRKYTLNTAGRTEVSSESVSTFPNLAVTLKPSPVHQPLQSEIPVTTHDRKYTLNTAGRTEVSSELVSTIPSSAVTLKPSPVHQPFQGEILVTTHDRKYTLNTAGRTEVSSESVSTIPSLAVTLKPSPVHQPFEAEKPEITHDRKYTLNKAGRTEVSSELGSTTPSLAVTLKPSPVHQPFEAEKPEITHDRRYTLNKAGRTEVSSELGSTTPSSVVTFKPSPVPGPSQGEIPEITHDRKYTLDKTGRSEISSERVSTIPSSAVTLKRSPVHQPFQGDRPEIPLDRKYTLNKAGRTEVPSEFGSTTPSFTLTLKPCPVPGPSQGERPEIPLDRKYTLNKAGRTEVTSELGSTTPSSVVTLKPSPVPGPSQGEILVIPNDRKYTLNKAGRTEVSSELGSTISSSAGTFKPSPVHQPFEAEKPEVSHDRRYTLNKAGRTEVSSELGSTTPSSAVTFKPSPVPGPSQGEIPEITHDRKYTLNKARRTEVSSELGSTTTSLAVTLKPSLVPWPSQGEIPEISHDKNYSLDKAGRTEISSEPVSTIPNLAVTLKRSPVHQLFQGERPEIPLDRKYTLNKAGRTEVTSELGSTTPNSAVTLKPSPVPGPSPGEIPEINHDRKYTLNKAGRTEVTSELGSTSPSLAVTLKPSPFPGPSQGEILVIPSDRKYTLNKAGRTEVTSELGSTISSSAGTLKPSPVPGPSQGEIPEITQDRKNTLNKAGRTEVSSELWSTTPSFAVTLKRSPVHQPFQSENESTRGIKRFTQGSRSFHFSITPARNSVAERRRSGSFVGVLERTEARARIEEKLLSSMKEKPVVGDSQPRWGTISVGALHKSYVLPWDKRNSIKKGESVIPSKDISTDMEAGEVESRQEVVEEAVEVHRVQEDEVKTAFGVKLRSTPQSLRLRSQQREQGNRQKRQEISVNASHECKKEPANVSCISSTSEENRLAGSAQCDSSIPIKISPSLTCDPQQTEIQTISSNPKEAETSLEASKETQPAPQKAPSEVSWMSLAVLKTRSLQQIFSSGFSRDFMGRQAATRPQPQAQMTSRTETMAGVQTQTSASLPAAADRPSTDASKAVLIRVISQAQTVEPKTCPLQSNTFREPPMSYQSNELQSQPNMCQSASQAVSTHTAPWTIQPPLHSSAQAEASSQSAQGSVTQSLAQFYLSSGQQQQAPWSNRGLQAANKSADSVPSVAALRPLSVIGRGEQEATVPQREDMWQSGRWADWPGSLSGRTIILEKQEVWTMPPGTTGVEVKKAETEGQALVEAKDTKPEGRQGLKPTELSPGRVPGRACEDKWLRKNVQPSSLNSSTMPPADSSQPSWMELAKRKSMAWNDKSMD